MYKCIHFQKENDARNQIAEQIPAKTNSFWEKHSNLMYTFSEKKRCKESIQQNRFPHKLVLFEKNTKFDFGYCLEEVKKAVAKIFMSDQCCIE